MLRVSLNWRTRRGVRKENSPVEDFPTSGENLLGKESCVSNLRERYKSIDRSELANDNELMSKTNFSSKPADISTQKKPSVIAEGFSKLAHSAGFELTTF